MLFRMADKNRSATNISKQSGFTGGSGSQGAASSTKLSERELLKNDFVRRDILYKVAIDKEKDAAKNWKSNWGFLTEEDPMGNPIQPEVLPEKSCMFSNRTSNTTTGQYGEQLPRETGVMMQQLQYRFYHGNHKKPIDKDLMCNW